MTFDKNSIDNNTEVENKTQLGNIKNQAIAMTGEADSKKIEQIVIKCDREYKKNTQYYALEHDISVTKLYKAALLYIQEQEKKGKLIIKNEMIISN